MAAETDFNNDNVPSLPRFADPDRRSPDVERRERDEAERRDRDGDDHGDGHGQERHPLEDLLELFFPHITEFLMQKSVCLTRNRMFS